MKTATYTLPAHWSVYLFYGGDNDLNQCEKDCIEQFTEDNCLLPVLSCSDSEEFRNTHDATAYGILPCDCLDFVFPVKESA